jgi:hypothetical protein
MIKFLLENKEVIGALGVPAYWLFSAACSSLPPLPEKAGFMLTWLHNFLQAVAGNINKIRN